MSANLFEDISVLVRISTVLDGSIKRDNEMISDIRPTSALVPLANVVRMKVLRCICSRAMDDYLIDPAGFCLALECHMLNSAFL
jgi:hypothetical protein